MTASDSATTSSSGEGPSRPLIVLLAELGLMPDPNSDQKAPSGAFDDTDPAYQIIKSGATKISKQVSGIIASAGGLGVIGTAITTAFSHFSPAEEAALIGGTAGLLGLSALSVALIISADLRSRGDGTAAQYRARGALAAAYESTLDNSNEIATPAAISAKTASSLGSDLSVGLLVSLAFVAAGGTARARLASDEVDRFITGLRYRASAQLEIRLSNTATPEAGDLWYPLTAMDEFQAPST